MLDKLLSHTPCSSESTMGNISENLFCWSWWEPIIPLKHYVIWFRIVMVVISVVLWYWWYCTYTRTDKTLCIIFDMVTMYGKITRVLAQLINEIHLLNVQFYYTHYRCILKSTTLRNTNEHTNRNCTTATSVEILENWTQNRLQLASWLLLW